MWSFSQRCLETADLLVSCFPLLSLPVLNFDVKMTTLLIFILLKLFVNSFLFLNFTSMKHTIFIKTVIILSTGISPSFLYQIAGNLKSNFSRIFFSFFLGFTSIFLNSVFLLVNPLAPPPYSLIRS